MIKKIPLSKEEYTSWTTHVRFQPAASIVSVRFIFPQSEPRATLRNILFQNITQSFPTTKPPSSLRSIAHISPPLRHVAMLFLVTSKSTTSYVENRPVDNPALAPSCDEHIPSFSHCLEFVHATFQAACRPCTQMCPIRIRAFIRRRKKKLRKDVTVASVVWKENCALAFHRCE